MRYYLRFLKYVKPYWTLALAASVSFVVSSFLGAYPIQLFKRAVDMAVGDVALSRDGVTSYLIWLAAQYISLRIALGGIQLAEAYLSKKLIQNVVFDLQSELYDHLQSQSRASPARRWATGSVPTTSSDHCSKQLRWAKHTRARHRKN